MKISKKSQYGLRAMVALALNYRKGPLSAKAISISQTIPLQYLEQIFNRLKKKKLVKTIRGPRGGYALSMDPSKVKVKHVMEALGESYSLTGCLGVKDNGPCTRPAICATENFWGKVDRLIKKVLNSTSLKELCPKAADDKGTDIGHRYPFQI